jgi:hypothetical protein
MQSRVAVLPALALAGAAVLGLPASAAKPGPDKVEVIASGLDNPRGVAIGQDRAVYVAEAGRGGDGACVTSGDGTTVCYGHTGAITRIDRDGTVARIVRRLPSLAPPPGAPGEGTQALGVHHLAFDRQGQGYAVIGFGANPALRRTIGSAGLKFGRVLRFDRTGQASFDEDVAAYEAANDPDGQGPDSDLFGLAVTPDGLVIADAGGNDVVQLSAGTISTLAVFPNVLVPFGPPGNMIPMQAVPTAVAIGPDDALYVGQLTGFPFPVGAASVYRLNGATPEVFADNFTNIVDIAFGKDGSLYVLEIAANSLLSGNPLGALIRVAPDGTRTEIAPGALISPGGMAIGKDGSIYVSRFGTLPGAGDVVRIKP